MTVLGLAKVRWEKQACPAFIYWSLVGVGANSIPRKKEKNFSLGQSSIIRRSLEKWGFI